MSAAAIAIADMLLSAGINYLLESQKVQSLIAQARAEGREVSSAELASLQIERDRISVETDALLDSVS